MSTEEPGRPVEPTPEPPPAATEETAQLPAEPPPPPPAAAGPSRWRRARSGTWRVAKHRVTLVIAALLIGSAIGAGTTAIVAANDNDRAAPARHGKVMPGPGHHSRGDHWRGHRG